MVRPDAHIHCCPSRKYCPHHHLGGVVVAEACDLHTKCAQSRLRGRLLLEESADSRSKPLLNLTHCRLQQLLFCAEVVLHCPDGDTGDRRDIADAQRVRSAGGQEFDQGIEDALRATVFHRAPSRNQSSDATVSP